MIQLGNGTNGRKLAVFVVALVGTTIIAFGLDPSGLSTKGQYAIATMFFAAVLWVTGVVPLAVTALSIPVLLTALGVYNDMDPALSGFADHLIFLFIAGFMIANALQKYNIDRRIALWIMSRMGSSPRRLILAIMLATAFLSMWVSNTATTAMMTPIALGVLAQVIGRDQLKEETADSETFSNMQIATLLGTAYAASVGGVGTLIGTPPNAVLATQLNAILGYEIGFVDWLLIGLPIVVVTLPLIWYLLTFRLYPPEIEDVSDARQQAREYLREEGPLSPRGRRVAYIFAATAILWIVGGLDVFVQRLGVLPTPWFNTLFGTDEGATVLGVAGHQGLLYYVMVGMYAIPALVLADTVEWEDIVDIDWGTILLFGGGIALADALATTGATEWLAQTIFGSLTGAPIVLVVGAVVLVVVLLTEMTSNTATSTIIIPILIGIGGVFATTLGLTEVAAAVFLAVSGAIAASFAFALPVATPPNAIVFGSGHLKQRHMMRAGMVLNVLMTLVLTGLIWLLFQFVWPSLLW
ncbi:solute carrier family 13 (sodium-dependent dicarboxylate transporter), member 2/3/5 [Halorientalis persicus]|uniref:Solute carrier family 13 (Sodium-dependent dicarboxylate transporter), member 2/3/5 n=1 Tax=Halorientalis persicus TaxID=1367881 RepID=A0A1H8QN33_9EURY|nr:DASS family sodium-coupled anion symporter [Halorientalis persicus]SEO55294.1 solute carrier family 13 (sodium-dependent dicarboxylate transporter), member 2/3/5 [Halorientalis persicus]